jgi:hypothetical protein
MKIVKGTASLFGKATKLIVSVTGGTYTQIVNGFVQGYTGIPDVPETVETRVVNDAQPTQTYTRPVQQEFVFNHVD